MKASTAMWLAAAFFARGETLDLSGKWTFRCDEAKVGLAANWFETPLPAGQVIRLPGTMDEGKLGPRNAKAPDLADLYRPYTYEGAAWYEREIEIPDEWRGKRVVLVLERCRWVTQVWLDGRPCGEPQDSLVTPHEHVLGVGLAPGKHRLTIRNDNTKWIDLGRFVSALYGGTPGNLNGIVGKIELCATPPVWIEDVQVYPDAAKKMALVKVRIGNVTGVAGRGRCQVSGVRCQDGGAATDVTWDAAGGVAEIAVALNPDAPEWDEFDPALVSLDLTLTPDTRHPTPSAPTPDTQTVRFGLRDLAARGTQFTVNGRPVFLRGTLECQVFPLTGYPPCDVPAWQRIYKIIKSYGLNHMRFHSWCPPEAAFAAADIEGIYLQVEAAQANVNAGSDPRRDAFTEAELHRIVRAYGNHPSFCLMALGNEYGGKDEVLSRWVRSLQEADPRHLYTSAANNRQMPTHRDFSVTPAGRGVHGPGTQHDLQAVVAGDSHPVVGHEIGQWTFFPDFDEMEKYRGVMEPRNFELVREQLRARGMLDQAKKFTQASGAQAVLLYKEEIEVLLRTAGYAGIQLLDLHDYPSQGTALIGPLDPFWESKGFVTPGKHREYSGATVPLLRMAKRVYTTAETLTGAVDVAHFGPADLKGLKGLWKISDTSGRAIARGEMSARDLPTGRLTSLGALEAPLAGAPAPAKLTVRVDLEGTEYGNEWEIWVYPDAGAPLAPTNVVVSRAWDQATRDALATGRQVLLLPAKRFLRNTLPGRFLPVFWSPVWFPSQKPNTMGILCDPKHPLFEKFPTESYSNWQWWDLADHSSVFILDEAPLEFRPLVQVIDNFARNHKLGSVFEAKVGPGRLLVCAIDLEQNLAARPAARQFAASLFAYLDSPDFRPRHALDPAQLDAVFAVSTNGLAGRLGAAASADSEESAFPADLAIDGDPHTFWHTCYTPAEAPFPHQLTLDLGKPMRLAGIRYLPRQDMSNGRIAEFAVLLSQDGKAWSAPVTEGRWPDGKGWQVVQFPSTSPRYLRIVAKSEVNQRGFATVAELDLVQEKTK